MRIWKKVKLLWLHIAWEYHFTVYIFGDPFTNPKLTKNLDEAEDRLHKLQAELRRGNGKLY